MRTMEMLDWFRYILLCAMGWRRGKSLEASDNISENGIDENQIEKQCKTKRSKELN